MKMSACLDDGTAAAFVDGTLDVQDRTRVVAHLATCPDCTELVAEVVRIQAELPAECHRPVKVSWMRRPGLAALGGLVVIAASIAFFVLTRPPVDPLVAILGSQRPTLARPTGGFHAGPVLSPVRAAGDEGANLQLIAEVARRVEKAARTNDVKDLRAAGVAQLMARDTAGAIVSLQAAVARNGDDADNLADLGAALMTRFLERGDTTDADRALDAFDKAVSVDGSMREPWFNRALLLEQLNRPDEARSAWERYFALPDDKEWRDEASRHRDALKRQ